ncbi:hypothetical protein BsWGS_20034 [Bradybaena similaris]
MLNTHDFTETSVLEHGFTTLCPASCPPLNSEQSTPFASQFNSEQSHIYLVHLSSTLNKVTYILCISVQLWTKPSMTFASLSARLASLTSDSGFFNHRNPTPFQPKLSTCSHF